MKSAPKSIAKLTFIILGYSIDNLTVIIINYDENFFEEK